MTRSPIRNVLVGLSTIAALVGSFITATQASAAVSYVEGTDPAAGLFNPLIVNDIDLTMSEEALGNLTQEMCNGGEYQPATLTMTTPTATYGPMTVGVRLKGCWGSYRPLSGKAGFKIKINYVAGQTILGLKKLTLNNMVQDPSMLHEAVGYRLFRAMGVPAPRVGYTNVSFNGAEYGLHANIETPDKVMLPRWYGAGQTAHLYEGSYWTDVIPDHVNNFEIDEGNDTRTDLETLAAANVMTGDAWWNAVTPIADLNEMTAMWATEFYLGHWDGYATRIWNNYYLHATPAGYFTMLPWGLDQTFSEELPYDVDPSQNAVMFQRCMDVPRCKALYAANVVKVARLSKSLKLDAMTTAVGNAIDIAVRDDPRREVDYDSSVWWRGQTRSWIAARPNSVTNWVTANTVQVPDLTFRRSGTSSVATWSLPPSHGLTIDQYQISVKLNGVWTTKALTVRTYRVSHPAGKTLSVKVRAHTALGWGAWSIVRQATRP